MLNVWPIYLHFGSFGGKRREIYHTLSISGGFFFHPPIICQVFLRYETSDHKATRNDEAERIKTAGGRVVTTEYEDSFACFFGGGAKKSHVLVVIFGWGWGGRFLGTLYFWLGLFFVLHGMCSALFFSGERYPKRVLFTSNPSRMTGFHLISHAPLSRTPTWKQATKDDTDALTLNFLFQGKICNPDLLMNAGDRD